MSAAASLGADLEARCRAQLLAHEGLRGRPYRCSAGRLTIGVGRNLDDVGISRDEAMYLLAGDVTRVTRALDERWPWWRGLSVPRAAVLLDMAFQLGAEGLAGFRRFLAALEASRWETAAEEMLDSKWARQDTPSRARRLAAQMRTDQLQPLPHPSEVI